MTSEKDIQSTRAQTSPVTQIAAAAEQLFAEQGYRKTTMAAIASRLGIGRTTVYDYFRSKEDILIYLIEQKIPHQPRPQLQGSLEERLQTLAADSLSRLQDNIHLYRVLFTEHPVLGTKPGDHLVHWQQIILSQVRMTIQDAIREHSFTPRCSLDQIVFAYTALVSQKMNGLILSDSSRYSQPIEQEARMIVDLLIRGTGVIV
ncbi:TetR/AcrR family transcriptional regulator [Spirochaeta lutea]|uniref:HTH tetR-type domain-containing protein n=1 Tax=Spirochaeta lutea TaxID=1480694 RepID=A0A098QUB6_9SPIO|nr:TetR/AcrR family transcriptional regulator [Spirochaeta lutea]KGE70988.1 hypothetical protein DC28_13760 [Spirochaeta lutea]